jgi:acetate kinase
VRVLVVNAGSSSLKLSVLEGGQVVAKRDLAADRDGFDQDELAAFLNDTEVDAVGHRVVHGGTEFTEPTVLDDEVLTALRQLTDLAPLHQPKSLAGIDAVAAARPGLPTVACFDTAFHATLSEVAYTYAIPAEWRSRWKVRRFGFHGLSHAYASRRAAELVGQPAAGLRLVVCHLGAGASLCAVADARSVDTTMGFTPLEGLVMATRSGSVDPGLVLWLQEHAGLSATHVAAALEHESGLLALGGDADMRALLPRAEQGDTAAILAIDVYVHRLVAGVAAMTATLGGLDVLVFTGGVGENASVIRASTANRLAHLGVELADDLNANTRGDADISSSNSPVRTVVVAAREDLEIERGVHAALGSQHT